MESTRRDRAWAFVTVLLLVIICAGAYTLWQKRSAYDQPLTIRPPEPRPTPAISRVYLGGAVNNPGFYNLRATDNLQELIRDAGGVTPQADLDAVTVAVPSRSSVAEPEEQKININTAGAWLLEALPQVGPATAQEIIAYRTKNGLFNTIQELENVKGVGSKKFDQIKGMITVR